MRSAPRRHDRDSPIEWTGEAHLVGVTCDGCGGAMTVPETVAHTADVEDRELTCEACEADTGIAGIDRIE